MKAHFDRFLEIEERSEREADERIRADSGNYEEQYKDYTFCMPLTDAEKICLFCEDAGGLIGFMKGYRESHEEEFEY